MKDKKYNYIISSDLDGTLLRHEQISAENALAIKELKEHGVCFAANSGRCFGELPKAILEQPDVRYYIWSDGAVIWDKETDSVISECCMSREKVRRVFDILDEYSTSSTVRRKGVSYADINKNREELYPNYRVGKGYGWFIDRYSEKIEDFDRRVREFEDVEMICVFFSTEEEQEACRKRLEELGDFTVASSWPENLEIFSKDAGKGSALLKLADLLGVPHENTFAVGDSKNEMDMIVKAGVGLAMGNATDELKAAAKKTICHVDDHSAKYILDNYFSIAKEK